jgi:oxygen-independent coproporphyrinogen-3 oxidase
MVAGVYLHIPFCKSRCSYCDFATDVYRGPEGVDRYIEALCAEIGKFANNGDLIDTIYFGGGTPSLLSAGQIENILNVVRSKFVTAEQIEITIEMNPATVTPASLKAFRDLGVNRASFGVQTFDDHLLKLLARGHDANDARTTFAMLRDAGFDNVSFDLIAGLPHQTLADWERNLDEAIALSPEHLSLYLLEVHQGTPLAVQIQSGRQPRPDEDLAAEMYEMLVEKLSGYEQYEISNFARPGFESRHNSKYWQLDPVFGFGVSAHSFDGSQRYANERDTARYVELVETGLSPEVMRENVDLASEQAFLGLRLENGLDLADYRKKFGVDLLSRFADEIAHLCSNELVDTSDGRLRLTGRGKLFSNEVFAVFV